MIKICIDQLICSQCTWGLRSEACNFIKKETLARVLSCEFFENFRNTFFTEHFWAIASCKFFSKEIVISYCREQTTGASVFFKYSKPLNSGHLRVLKYLSIIKRCSLLGGSLTKIVTFWTRCSKHVRYLGCPLLRGFTAYQSKTF